MKNKKTSLSGKPKVNTPKKRNPLTLNPLMSKSHIHDDSKKSQRQQAKNTLRKALKENLE